VGNTQLKTVPISPQVHSEVAVIIPCYNVERYLQRALDSVFSQTFSDFEIYAVDDGSTDGTTRVLEANANRCRFVSQTHAGPAAARNRAIRMSNSPFVAFLDADDEWLPRKLESQIALLKQDPALGLACSLGSFDESGDEKRANPAADNIPRSGRMFQSLVRDCFVFTPTAVVRRRCLEEVGLFNESLAVSEDFNLWLRIAAHWPVVFSPELLAVAHKRPESLSACLSPEQRLRYGIAALEHVQSSCPGLSPSEVRALREILAERVYLYGSFLLSTGAKAPSRRTLASALMLQPTHGRAFARLILSFLPTRLTQPLVELKRKFLDKTMARKPAPIAPRGAAST
jgi:cellulose synthase/poly-beta-1,6-N-acetylglucosamine synthase-like glycosyltransferase